MLTAIRSPMRRSAARVRSALSPREGNVPPDTARGTAACGRAADVLAASSTKIIARVSTEIRPGAFRVTGLNGNENRLKAARQANIGIVL